MPNKINISTGKQEFIVYVVLAIIALAVFWQANQYDFVFDDFVYVADNSHVQSGITMDGIRWAFGSKYFGLWNPLVWLSFILDHQFYGLNAGGYHITNLILHILSTLLLFFNLLVRMNNKLLSNAIRLEISLWFPIFI